VDCVCTQVVLDALKSEFKSLPASVSVPLYSLESIPSVSAFSSRVTSIPMYVSLNYRAKTQKYAYNTK
jgi:hypothetical protein